MFRESVLKIRVFSNLVKISRSYSSKKIENKFRFAESYDSNRGKVGGTVVRITTPFETVDNSNYEVTPDFSTANQSDDLLEIAQRRKSQVERFLKEDPKNANLRGDRRVSPPKSRFLNRNAKQATTLEPKEDVKGEILFGIHPVLIALQARRRRFYALYVKSTRNADERRDEIEKLAKEESVTLKYVDVQTLNYLSGKRVHQGVCADVSPLEPTPYVNSTCQSENEKPPVWLLLYNITDPMNFGAILRSSYFFGIERVLCTRNDSCVLSPVVSKASSGALELTEIQSVDDVLSFIQQHKEIGWSFVGTLGDGGQAVDVNAFAISKPTVILMGNEGEGLGNQILELCDVVVNIKPGKELNPLINSLNVSAAASIILQRLLSKK